MIKEIEKYKIKKIHPRLFFTECCICNREFKHENGYKIDYGYDYRNIIRIYNICKHCAPTKEIAKQYADNGIKILRPLKEEYKSKPPKAPKNQYGMNRVGHIDNSDLNKFFKSHLEGEKLSDTVIKIKDIKIKHIKPILTSSELFAEDEVVDLLCEFKYEVECIINNKILIYITLETKNTEMKVNQIRDEVLNRLAE